MLKDEILDLDFNEKRADTVLDIVDWWERKRMIYNLILVSIELIVMFSFRRGVLEFGIGDAILWSIAYTMVANIFFSVGWGIGILGYYYNLKILKTVIKFRVVFLVVEILLAVILTIVVDRDTLDALQMYYNY